MPEIVAIPIELTDLLSTPPAVQARLQCLLDC